MGCVVNRNIDSVSTQDVRQESGIVHKSVERVNLMVPRLEGSQVDESTEIRIEMGKVYIESDNAPFGEEIGPDRETRSVSTTPSIAGMRSNTESDLHAVSHL